MARTRLAGWIPGPVLLALLISAPSPASASHPCDRFALDGVALGMSPKTVQDNLGSDGMSMSIRLPDGGRATGLSYPDSSHRLYVEFDQRIDRRKARVVRLQGSLSVSRRTFEDLVRRFGQPNAGADDLKNDLENGGPAVWIDHTCGLVVTAFRSSASWWTAEGGFRLQVETFELALRNDSPARSKLTHGAGAPVVARPGAAPPRPPAAVSPLPIADVLADDLSLPEQAPAPAVVTARPPRRALAVDLGAAASTGGFRRERPLIPTSETQVRPVAPSVPPQPLPPPPVVPETTKKRANPKDAPAERIGYVEPVCPPTAKWLGVKGHVTVAILVQADGTVAKSVSLINAIPRGRGFEEATIAAVRQWRYTPATRGGRPVASRLTVTINIE